MLYLTVSEAAKALQLSVPTVKRYIYEGKLKSSKLPGGQHRIPRSEIERLLAPDAEEQGEELSRDNETYPLGDRLAVLERWVTELQAEVERLTAALEVMSRYCVRLSDNAIAAEHPKSSGSEHSVVILGPGCRRCRALYELTTKVLGELKQVDVPIEHVKDLDDIAAYGPVVTPALVVDGSIVVSGRVPTETALKGVLARYLR